MVGLKGSKSVIAPTANHARRQRMGEARRQRGCCGSDQRPVEKRKEEGLGEEVGGEGNPVWRCTDERTTIYKLAKKWIR